MARKMYETGEHLRRERLVADELEFDWKSVLKKVSYKLTVDFAICRDGIIKGWVEVKTRKISSTHLPEYMISMHKMIYAFRLSKDTNLPFFLVVKFTCI